MKVTKDFRGFDDLDRKYGQGNTPSGKPNNNYGLTPSDSKTSSYANPLAVTGKAFETLVNAGKANNGGGSSVIMPGGKPARTPFTGDPKADEAMSNSLGMTDKEMEFFRNLYNDKTAAENATEQRVADREFGRDKEWSNIQNTRANSQARANMVANDRVNQRAFEQEKALMTHKAQLEKDARGPGGWQSVMPGGGIYQKRLDEERRANKASEAANASQLQAEIAMQREKIAAQERAAKRASKSNTKSNDLAFAQNYMASLQGDYRYW